MRLSEIMNPRVVTIGPKEAADVAWGRMQRRRIRHLVVMEDAHLVGILSERDLGGRSGADLRRSRVVEELMTARLVSVEPTMTLREAANLMRGRRIGCLPVLDGDRLVGIVTATDVLDELGRGSTRPIVRAKRPTLRLPAGQKRLGGRPVVVKRPQARGKAVRGRRRQPDSAKRAPLAGHLPKALKRRAGTTDGSQVPAHIRVLGAELSRDDRTYIRRKLGLKLGKFATSIERISVRVEDANGPRGGIDQVCRIKVVVSGLPSVVFQAKDASLAAAIDGALMGVERAVRRTVQRRRTKPIRGRSDEVHFSAA
jgi:CBS domain-containing protein/ribosome-associated translation inhibitor RaiA